MDQAITLTPTRTRFTVLAETGSRRLRRIAAQARVRVGGVRLGDPMTAALAAVVVLTAYFLAFPGVDIAVSGLFHGPDGFALSQNPALKALRKSSTLVMAGALVAILVMLVQRAIRTGKGGRTRTRRCLFLLSGLALGPGLVVNTLFKENWGRARPIQTDLFGGDADFTGVWAISDGCQNNCSFVSGEASSSAWMVCALVMLVPASARPWIAPPAALYAVALSANRIAFGGHYLSDVLLSWAITGLVLAALYRVMAARRTPAHRPLRIAAVPALA